MTARLEIEALGMISEGRGIISGRIAKVKVCLNRLLHVAYIAVLVD